MFQETFHVFGAVFPRDLESMVALHEDNNNDCLGVEHFSFNLQILVLISAKAIGDNRKISQP